MIFNINLIMDEEILTRFITELSFKSKWLKFRIKNFVHFNIKIAFLKCSFSEDNSLNTLK